MLSIFSLSKRCSLLLTGQLTRQLRSLCTHR